MKPYLAFIQGQNAVFEASESRIGWPFMSAIELIPASGWASSTCGSFCMKAATARTGAWTLARFMTMKLFDPSPSSTAPEATSSGTLVVEPPGMMRTSRPRLAYSPVASAS